MFAVALNVAVTLQLVIDSHPVIISLRAWIYAHNFIICPYVDRRSRDSIVSIATSYGMGRPGFEFRRGQIFLSPETSRRALGNAQPPIQWIPGFLQGRKATRLRMGGAIPLLPPTYLHDVDRDNLMLSCLPLTKTFRLTCL